MATQTPQKSATAVRTRRALVHLLKQEGPLDAQELAARLHVSAMAVRQHLYALHAEQLVTYHETPRPRGRPAKRWQLTPAADRLFPEAYAELTLSLLTSITETFGKPGLERLLALRSRQQVAAYRAQMREHCPICAAAVACTGLCANELEVFQEVLGAEITIERTEHIVAGAPRCAYRVSSGAGIPSQAPAAGQGRLSSAPAAGC